MKIVAKRPRCVIWLTGLSGAGKTTIANALADNLKQRNIVCAMLDGDELRKGLNADLGFSTEDRLENVRRVAHVAKLFSLYAEVVIVALISPTRYGRELARSIIGTGMLEIFVDAPISVCESRDPKGLYHKVRAGAIPKFTGVSDAYEPPAAPALVLRTDQLSIGEEIDRLKDLIDAYGQVDQASTNDEHHRHYGTS